MDHLFTLTLFVVDDDPFTGLLYKKHLSNLGFQRIHHFLSGVDCLNSLHLNPQIVLLDHQMTEITGFEVLKKIKRYDPNTAVLMVSGQEDMATAVDALKYGAFDYIIKDGSEKSHIEDALQRLSKLQALRPKPTKSIFQKLISPN